MTTQLAAIARFKLLAAINMTVGSALPNKVTDTQIPIPREAGLLLHWENGEWSIDFWEVFPDTDVFIFFHLM